MSLDLFTFNDYRSFLLAKCEERRQSQKHFSLASWARRLSLKSSSTLIMILNGTRNPGAELVEDLIADMGLSADEAEYFRNLVLLEKSKTNRHLRDLIVERMPKMASPNLQLMKMKYFRLCAQWYFMAIRELADLPGFQEDPAWIQRRLLFHVSKSQIQEALDVLLEIGLLKRNEEHKLEYTASMATTFDVPSEDIRKFHQSALEVCQDAVDTVSPEDREMLNAIFTLDAKKLPLVKEKIREILKSLAAVSDGENDSVFMLQVACVPLTRKENSEGDPA